MKRISFLSLVTILLVGVFASSCTSSFAGTYEWEKDGFHYSVTISSKDKAPCTVHFVTPSGTPQTYQTSYTYWKYTTSGRPQLYIADVAFIDPDNLEVYCTGVFYEDESDFAPRRNAVPCVKR